MTRGERLALGSIGIGTVVLAIKAAAWWLTGSAAIYSDALESTVNVAAAIVTLGAIRLAGKPADENHPYGHDKAEFFAALMIFEHAWSTYRHPQPLDMPATGLALNAVATVINAVWAVLLIRAGR